MNNVIRVGILGQGRSGRDIHALHLATQPRKFRIVAIADPMEERRRRAEEEFGCRAYQTAGGLLKQHDLDLIVVAGPSKHHASVSLKALNAGFHVLCEKPVARKVAEVDALRRTAKRVGKVATVFHQQRFDPTFTKLRQVIDSGAIGRIVMVKVSASNFARRWDWQTLRKEDGGNLLNTGSHYLDQALQLFGPNKLPRVVCTMDRANTFGDAEDHVKLLLMARGRPTIDLEVSSCCAFPPQEVFNVYGTRGGAQLTREQLQWRFYRPREQPKRSLDLQPIAHASGLPAYCREEMKWHERSWKPTANKDNVALYYENLYRCLIHGEPSEVTLEQARIQVSVTAECLRQCPTSSMGEPAVA